MRTLYRSLFKEIGEAGNERLLGKTVTVAGLGGVGSIVTSILAREDFDLRVIDKGRVEEVDMNRMGLYQETDITKFKAKQAKARAQEINPKLTIKCFHEELTPSNVFLVKSACVIDATNNDDTNTMIFDYCQQAKVPLIIASYHGATAELLVATKKIPRGVFLKYLDMPKTEKAGAISSATHTAAAIAVAEAFKVCLNKATSKLVSYDVWTGKYKEKKL